MSAHPIPTPARSHRERSRAEHLTWFAVVLVSSLVLPGSGLLIAVAASLTRLSDSPRPVRIGLVALAAAVLVLQVGGLLAWGGGQTTVIGPEAPAT